MTMVMVTGMTMVMVIGMVTSMVTYKNVVEATVDIIREAETQLPDDVIDALKNARQNESSDVARSQIDAILKNIDIAAKSNIPLCQDTGILIFYVEIGRELKLDIDLKGAILEASRIATQEVPLRPNAVHPITRSNSSDNTGDGLPDIKYDFVEGDQLKITVAPKGAGSENMSALKMMNPTELKDIRKFILETVLNAGGRPCPPIVVGVGIGGSFDKAARLAKSALLRKVTDMTEEERSILKDINSLGIGPMGLGGDSTALAVHLATSYCHTASLPVAINIQCWANRHASVVLGGDE